MPSPEIFDVTCEMRAETPKAILYYDGAKEFWVPKSMIANGDIDVVNNNTGTVTLTAPVWWLKQRGVI